MGELVDPLASMRDYLAAEKSDSTRRAYALDFADFRTWCDAAGETALPASPLLTARYFADLADRGLKVSTIVRRAAAIRHAHRFGGYEPPTNAEGVKAVLRGIRRRLGVAPVRKSPATADVLALVIKALPSTLAGARDRALLLVGFAAALRRSELVALHVSDVSFRAAGMILTLRKSKTDQEGKGVLIPVARGRRLRPVDAIEAWLKAADIVEGPIFREVDRHGNVSAEPLSDRSVARIVKRSVKAVGLDEVKFAGHSLRAGFVTTSLDSKVDSFKIMQTTRHVRVDTLRIYDRRENDFDSSAGSDFL